MKVNFNIKLTPAQKKAYEYLRDEETKVLVCVWSRQQGKTVLCEIILMEELFKKNKFSAYISPSYQLGRKVFRDIVKMLEPTGVIKSKNSSTLTIESIFGSTLQMFSAESPTAIRGTTVDGILILDEMAFYPDTLPSGEDFLNNIVLPLTKARKPKMLCVSTPRGKRGSFYDYYNRALRGDKGYALIENSIYNDALISKEEIEELKRSMPPLAFQQEFEVKFLDNALTVFQGYERCFKPIKNYSQKKIWIGIDLSADGEDNTILTKINEENQVLQYIIEGSLDNKYKQIASLINATPNLQGVYIESNGIGTPMINEITKLVRHYQKIKEWSTTNKSKEQIISNLMMEIANDNITFDETNRLLFSELSTFTCKYSKNGNMQFQGIGNSHDDTVMSLAIALQAKNDIIPFTKQNIKILNSGKQYIE